MQREQDEVREESEEALQRHLATFPEVEPHGPEQLKLKAVLGIENLWWFGLAMTLGLGLTTLWLRWSDIYVSTYAIVLLFAGAALFTLFLTLTDNFYVLDASERKLLYHRQFLGISGTKTLCTFSQIEALVTFGRYTEEGVYYGLILLTKDNRRISLVKQEEYKNEECNKLGEALGAFLGCEHHPCGVGEETKITYEPREGVFSIEQALGETYTKENFFYFLKVIGVVLAVGTLFLGVLYYLQ